MSNRMFGIVLVALLCLGLVFTVWHVVYAIDAYQHSSIITFIAKELW